MLQQIIAGRYQIQERIGAGGMGTVFKALDTETQTIVAIKALNPESVLTRPDSVERFRREGQALRELNHPSIVKIFDTVEENGNQYLIQEFLGGGDLKSRILDMPLSIKEVLNIALDLADALTRAHRLNIIHRDLKPANVLLDDAGKPHLSDFGIALIGGMERVTEKGSAIGTADYMSPEMLRAEEIDARTDVWSFGVMLFEMISGKRPFTGKSLGQIIAQVMHTATPDLEKLRPDVPVDLVDLVYRMLEKDRNVRLSTVRMVGAELETILRGRSTDPLDTSSSEIVNLQRFTTSDETDRQNNLPAPTTPFVGRAEELAELQGLLVNPAVRLITILAPGGMGKTRLAIEVAQRQMVNFRHGAFFIALAPLDDVDTILSEIAEAIGFQFKQNKTDIQQQLLDFLRDKQMLLVMDNFEHLLDAANLVNDILEAAPNVTVLVTSRQRLNQSSETVFNLEGLELPDWTNTAEALQSSAAQLFLQGAKRAQPGFEIRARDLPHVAEICTQLQGMPLGILLAASWVEMLSLPEIAKEMRENLDFLETELEDVPERQRSLRAVFDYSWNLLSEHERSVFMKLSVFRNGFSRQAAQNVTGANLRVLMGLMNKSLLRRNPETGRYWVHELLRQYAMVKLIESGERSATQEAHAIYFTDLMKQITEDLKGRKLANALKIMDADYENMRYTGVHWLRVRDWSRLYDMMQPIARYGTLRNRFDERNSLFKIAAEAVDNYPLTHAFQPVVKAMYGYYIASHDIAYFERCLTEVKQVGAPNDIAYCSWAAGMSYKLNNQHDKAMPLFEQASALFAEHGARFEEAAVLQSISESLLAIGEIERAVEVIEACLEIRRKIKDLRGEGAVLVQLGAIHMVRANYDKAEYYWQRARDIITEVLGDSRVAPEVSISLALVLFLRGDNQRSYELAQEMYNAATEYNIPDYQSFALAVLALIMVVQGEMEMAQAYIAEMDALTVREFDYWIEADKYWARSLVAIATGNLPMAKRWTKEALQVGLSSHGTLMIWTLPVAALIAAQEGRDERAVELMALSLHHPTSSKEWLEQWALFNQRQTDLKAKLDDAYEVVWERGKSLDLAIVVAAEIQHMNTTA
jgi:serine/threonine protein kinase/tetratricopeptide (TPR) repeat protein